MSSLEEHEAEQAEITARCEAGECDHPDCWANIDPLKAAQERSNSSDADAPIHRALIAYCAIRNAYGAETSMELGESVAQMLCDLRHLTDLTGSFFAMEDRTGHLFYRSDVEANGTASDDFMRCVLTR